MPLLPAPWYWHGNEGDLLIEAPEASEQALYVQSATLDGAPIDQARVPHASIAGGATLDFDMGAAPSTWATR